MNTFLPHEYTAWLKRFITANPGDQKAPLLINQLASIQSIDELEATLKVFMSHHAAPYTPMTLNQKLTEWHDYLARLKSDHARALVSLQESTIAIHFPSFGALLYEVINSPKALLHPCFASIIAAILHPRFTELPEYLTQLNHSPAQSSELRSGSFSALTAFNPEHQASVDLLSHLSANFEEDNELYQTGNTLIQTTLIVYQDINFEEIDLNETATPPEETKNNFFEELYQQIADLHDDEERKPCSLQ